VDSILQSIEDWFRELLVSGIMNNIGNTFDSVNNQVGQIATEVGTTPAAFSPAIFNMIRTISENVIMPIAGIILTFIAVYELIQLVISHNNLAHFETWIFWKWIFKNFVAVTWSHELLSIDASDISDRMLADFLNMESSQIVTMHIRSVDQNEAIKKVKHTITELDRSKIQEQKKAVRAGYDMDIIPSDLATFGKDAKALLKELQSQNERMFLLIFLVMNTGRTEQELENNVFQAKSIAQKHNCNLVRLDFQQEQGLMSSLPIAENLVDIQRGMTTSSTAIFVPFTTQELFRSGDESLYYGLNALSNNLIMVDRKLLKNPNGLILGTPGSGKSFAAKIYRLPENYPRRRPG